MRSALVLQQQDDCPPGALAAWADARGVALTVIRPDRGELPGTDGFDAVVVLGSDRSVNDEQPWIADELAWPRGAVAHLPVLGICFGAQALAVALGGRVERRLPEIDWLPLGVDVDAELGCGPARAGVDHVALRAATQRHAAAANPAAWRLFDAFAARYASGPASRWTRM